MPRLSLESLETRETPAAIQPQTILANPDGGDEAVRHRLFSIVDRTQVATDDYAGSHALYQDITIPASADTPDGRKYKMLVSPLILDGDTVSVGTANGGVWKTTNGGAADSFYGTGVYKSVDSGRTG